jgi:type II secretory pathway component PulF
VKRRDVSRQRVFLGIFFPVFTTVICFGVLRFLQLIVLPYLREMIEDLSYNGGTLVSSPRMFGLFDMALILFACLIVPLLFLFAVIFYCPASKSIVLSRFCTLLELVFRARLPLEECHRLARRVFSGHRFRRAVDRLFQKLYAGTSVAEAFGSTKYFCGELSWMVTAGESTGDVPGALSDAASFHGLRADSKLSSLFNIAPPIITIAIAVPVGIVAVSVVAFLRWCVVFAG